MDSWWNKDDLLVGVINFRIGERHNRNCEPDQTVSQSLYFGEFFILQFFDVGEHFRVSVRRQKTKFVLGIWIELEFKGQYSDFASVYGCSFVLFDVYVITDNRPVAFEGTDCSCVYFLALF